MRIEILRTKVKFLLNISFLTNLFEFNFAYEWILNVFYDFDWCVNHKCLNGLIKANRIKWMQIKFGTVCVIFFSFFFYCWPPPPPTWSHDKRAKQKFAHKKNWFHIWTFHINIEVWGVSSETGSFNLLIKIRLEQ